MLDFPKLNLTTTYRCDGCGGCCSNLFGKRFGAAITTEEKQILEVLASRRGISVNFLPLSRDFAGKVTTWQFSDNKCPFLDSSEPVHKCKIYRWRPLLCRAYPLMPYGVGDCHSVARSARLFRVTYTPEQVAAGNEYMVKVASRIKGAAEIYDINRNKWRPNQL